jgi:hypothetical protein
MKRSFKWYLVKINRISGWCLLFLIPILFITGYGITGDYAWAVALGSAEAHSIIHKFFIPYAIGIFIVHSIINVYFSIKRWRKTKN